MTELRGDLPKLLSFAVHEFRTPLTVVAGYLRMLLKDRAGPVPEAQRKLLEEAERSCARLSGLLAELSDLSSLEGGRATFNRHDLALFPLVDEVAEAVCRQPGRDVRPALQGPAPDVIVNGDPVRLRAAFTAVLSAVLRDAITTRILALYRGVRTHAGEQAAWIAAGEPAAVDELRDAMPEELTDFDLWRGGTGLALVVARRVIDAHGGHLWSPASELRKQGVAILLPVRPR